MRKLLTACAVICLFASCQKEINFDDNNPANTGTGGTGNTGGTGGSGSGLLVKAVAVTGSETQTTIYTYDSQKRLESMKITGVSGGMPIDSYHKYVRDNAGRIVKVLQKVADVMGIPSDTAVMTYHYPNATTQNFDYSIHVMTLNLPGMPMSTIDSAVYVYNSAGRMTMYNQYMSSSLMPGTTQMSSKWEFAYDASDRVTNMKNYTDAANPGSSVMDLDMEWKYTYGTTSVNNLYFTSNGAQNFAMHGLPNTTNNFISKMESTSATTVPPVDIVITTSYVNGPDNKPKTATVLSVQPGQPNQTTNYTFFYQ